MRFKFTIIVSLLLILFGFTNVSASDKQVNLYYFHAEGCPTCALETTYLEELTSKDTNLVLHKYEIAFDKENQKLKFSLKQGKEGKEGKEEKSKA